MQQKIKLTCPSRQLFIKITFAFMKIFDFLVKIAIFGAFLFRSRDSRQALLPQSSVGFGQKFFFLHFSICFTILYNIYNKTDYPASASKTTRKVAQV